MGPMRTVISAEGRAMAARLNEHGTPLGHVDHSVVGVARFWKHPRWEIHPHGDELLIGIVGELELTILCDDGPATTVLQPGHAIGIPKNTWHSPIPRSEVSLLSMANYEGTAVSDDLDPRPDGGLLANGQRRTPPKASSYTASCSIRSTCPALRRK
jgi:quercetin dioxygenase-like cupin family protein